MTKQIRHDHHCLGIVIGQCTIR